MKRCNYYKLDTSTNDSKAEANKGMMKLCWYHCFVYVGAFNDVMAKLVFLLCFVVIAPFHSKLSQLVLWEDL